MFAEMKRSPVTHSGPAKAWLGGVLLLCATGLTGCIAQASETDEAALSAEGTTHVDGEQVESTSAGPTPGPINPDPEEPQPSPWRPSNPGTGPLNVTNAASTSPSPGSTPQPSPWHPPTQPVNSVVAQTPTSSSSN